MWVIGPVLNKVVMALDENIQGRLSNLLMTGAGRESYCMSYQAKIPQDIICLSQQARMGKI